MQRWCVHARSAAPSAVLLCSVTFRSVSLRHLTLRCIGLLFVALPHIHRCARCFASSRARVIGSHVAVTAQRALLATLRATRHDVMRRVASCALRSQMASRKGWLCRHKGDKGRERLRLPSGDLKIEVQRSSRVAKVDRELAHWIIIPHVEFGQGFLSSFKALEGSSTPLDANLQSLNQEGG